MVPEASKIIGLPHSKFTNQDSSLHVYVPDLSKDQFGIPKRQTIIKEKVTVVATLQFNSKSHKNTRDDFHHRENQTNSTSSTHRQQRNSYIR